MQSSEKDVENTTSTVEKEGGIDAQIYELGYLLVPTIPEEDLSVDYGNIKELISTSGGEAIADDMPKMMNLAYPMYKVVENIRTKFSTGYFGWVKFHMTADKILEFKKHLDADPHFLRFLIIKTVKENTMASKRFMQGERYRRGPAVKRYVEKVEPAVPINKEEVDKEIDALVSAQ